MPRIARLTRLGMVVLIAAAPIAGAAVLPAPAALAQQGGSSAEQSKEITNYGTGDKLDAKVRVSATADLFDRQQVEVDLSGFKPTWNANNTSLDGQRMEFPVVVMQCRGADPDPTTCLNAQRGRWEAGFDANASPADRALAEAQASFNDIGPYPADDVFDRYAALYRASQLPFTGPDGTSYLWVTANLRPGGAPLIDEPRLKSYPPTDVTSQATGNTRIIPVAPDGTNEFLFEVRQNATQPSLACTDRQKCSIVVVPIMDLPCVDPLPEKGANCTAGPRGPQPGTPQGQTDNNNPFVSAQEWLAASNWRNRFVIPISFAPDLATCDVRNSKAELPEFGSELVGVAQERWTAAYCTGARSVDYLPRYSVGSEYFARRQITTKLGTDYGENAVFVTQPVTESPRPIAHAPTAITGFAVAFAVDDGNGRQVVDLTLNARLLAKLLTESYNPTPIPASVLASKRPWDGKQPIPDQATADKYYVAHPALLHNPRSLFADPEFADLNPNFVLNDETGTLALHLLDTLNPMMITIDSDVVMDVTRYVTSDPAARAWLDGQPDPYGMRVNPAWLGLRPTQAYALADTWVRPALPHGPGWRPDNWTTFFVQGAGTPCDELFPSPMLTRLSNPASSAKGAAQMLLDRRGSATRCLAPNETNSDVYSEGKNVPSDFGHRAQLALTTVPLARLYQLPMAKLVNAGGKAVAPTDGAMVNALHVAVVDPTSGTIQIDHKRVTGDHWYPGTMVSYLAVPTSGLDREVAARYADYIGFMVTTGQVPGPTLVNLPPGYDPLPPALVKQAKDAAAAIAAQRGEVPAPPPDDVLGDGLPPGYTGDQAAQADNPGSGLPVTAQSAGDDKTKKANPERLAQTGTDSSWLARWAIPLLIGLGLLAGAVAAAIQVGARPDHPVRRVLSSLWQAVGRR